MLPSETPLKPFSESYVDFALPIEVQSCDNAFLMFLIVFARNIFNLKGLGLFNSWAVYGGDQVMDCLNVPIFFWEGDSFGSFERL